MMNDFAASADILNARPSIQVPLTERSVTVDLSGDFSLPDYQPEIKRLLRIGVGILPPTCSPDAGGSEIGGTLDYYVLYMGHDNALWCAPLSTEYRTTIPMDDSEPVASAGEPIICLCDITTEPPVGRVTAPRRLSIRCKLTAHVKLYGECLPGVEPGAMGDDSGTESTEYLTAKQEVGRLYHSMGELLPLQDDIILTPSESGEWRVICAEGTVMMNEATPTEGAVNCRGEVTVKLSLCPAESVEVFASDEAPARRTPPTLTVMQRKIPFSQTVDIEGVTSACSANACGFCTDLAVQMEEGHVHLDLGVLTEVRAQKNEVIPYVKDLYSTRRDGTTRHATYPTECVLRAVNGNVTLSDSLPLSEIGLESGDDIRVMDVTAMATPEALTADPEKGRCVLTGTCRAHLLLLRDGEYTSADMSLPFRYEFDDQSLARQSLPVEQLGFEGSVVILNCRARTDSERVALDAELALILRTHIASPLIALSEVSLGDEVTRRRGEYVICFPAPTDTLWSVAKRYHAPIAALTVANNLSAAPADSVESLEGVGYLIV